APGGATVPNREVAIDSGRSLSAMSEPSEATVIVQPGRITAVVSRSSTIAGPSTTCPTPSAVRRKTGVSTASDIRPKCTARDACGAPVPDPTTATGSTALAGAYADSRHVTASMPTSGIVSP